MGPTACVLAAAGLLLAPFPIARADSAPWIQPVEAQPTRGFAPGVGAFQVSGHAGIDYDVPAGSPVEASDDGVVAFAGEIAGATFVVLDHGGGVRTTYGQLAVIRVRHGDAVARGDALGLTGGTGLDGHPSGILHFGLRVDGVPVDPMTLFRPPDLTAVVHLVPAGDPQVASAAAERRRAARWFGPDQAPSPWLWDPDGGHRSSGGGALALLGRGTAWVAGHVVDAAETTWNSVASVEPTVAAEWAARWVVRGAVFAALAGEVSPPVAYAVAVESQELLWAAGGGARDWWRLRNECTADPPGRGEFEGTGNRLVVVSGVNSATGPDGSTSALQPADLGYGRGSVTWFSYAEGGGAYDASDTQVGPEVGAERLARQLRELARTHPTDRIDLIGHSQGGVVVEAFLKLHYAGHEAEFPPLGRVVTLAAPHRGSAVAALAGDLTQGLFARPVADALAGWIEMPGPGSASTAQLAEGSDFLAGLAGRPLPVEVVSIGGVDDVLVTADQTRLVGAEHVVVDPEGWLDHSEILTDEAALGAVRLALAGRPPPCVSLPEAIHHRVEPTAIHGAFDLLRSSDVREVIPGLSSLD